MSYDEGLAERLRDLLEDERDITEKRMFGGLAFLLNGKMCVGIVKDELMARVGPEQHADALAEPHVRPMDFTGRAMKGFLFVAQDGLESDERLKRWVDQGLTVAREAARPTSKRRTRR